MSYGTGHPLQGHADLFGTVLGQSLSNRCWGVIYQQHLNHSNDFVPRPLWRLLEEIDVVWVLSHHDLRQVDRSFCIAWQTEGIEVPVRQKEAAAGPAVVGSLSVARRNSTSCPVGRMSGVGPGISLSGFCQNQK